MTPDSFIYWLHGFFEISESKTLSEKQVQVIKDHLDLCFNKVTPDRSREEWMQPYFEREVTTDVVFAKTALLTDLDKLIPSGVSSAPNDLYCC